MFSEVLKIFSYVRNPREYEARPYYEARFNVVKNYIIMLGYINYLPMAIDVIRLVN